MVHVERELFPQQVVAEFVDAIKHPEGFPFCCGIILFVADSFQLE